MKRGRLSIQTVEPRRDQTRDVRRHAVCAFFQRRAELLQEQWVTVSSRDHAPRVLAAESMAVSQQLRRRIRPERLEAKRPRR